MKVGDLIKYHNEWSAVNGALAVIVGFENQKAMVKVFCLYPSVLVGKPTKFGAINVEVISENR